MGTALDRTNPGTGYWPSAWPVECGGNRRQKARTGRLDASLGTAEVVTRHNDRWNVMAVERDKGEWYLGGTMPAFIGPPPFGWVQKIDLSTLEPIVESKRLTALIDDLEKSTLSKLVLEKQPTAVLYFPNIELFFSKH